MFVQLMRKIVRLVFYVICSLLVAVIPARAQRNFKRVLFLGNSYTQVNNLPQMLQEMAKSTNDSLLVDNYTPGGYRLQNHASDLSAITKIAAGNWDFVVLQEQSQLPSFTDIDVATDVFPFARKLDSLIKTYNPCAQTIFYMTWGRKNGDAQNCPFWPPVCTYAGMDSLLHLRYRMMADSNNAFVSPVGAVWREIRDKYPEIELYQTDESHPALEGTYAAASAFFAVIFRKNPLDINYFAGLSSLTATKIRTAAKNVAFDSLLHWNVGRFDPMAQFTFTPIANNSIQFTNTSQYAKSYWWNFGDGDSSIEINPKHVYALPDEYLVTLHVTSCSQIDTSSRKLVISNTALPPLVEKEKGLLLSPNPATNQIHIQSSQSYIGDEYFILNPIGSVVLKGILHSENTEVSIIDLPKGLYFFRSGNQQNKAIRFIKK